MYLRLNISKLPLALSLFVTLTFLPTDAKAAPTGCSVSLSGKKTFKDLQNAHDKLSSSGGKICLAKGMYISNSSATAPLLTIRKSNVTIEADGDALLGNWSTARSRDVIVVDKANRFTLKKVSIITAGTLSAAVKIQNGSSSATIRNANLSVYGDAGVAISGSSTTNLQIYNSVVLLNGSSICSRTGSCYWGNAKGIEISGGNIETLDDVSFHQSNDSDIGLKFYGGGANSIKNLKVYGKGTGIDAIRNTSIQHIHDYTTAGPTALNLSRDVNILDIKRMKASATNRNAVDLSYNANITYVQDSHLKATGKGHALSLSYNSSIYWFSKSYDPSITQRVSLTSEQRSAIDINFGSTITRLQNVDITSSASYGISFFGDDSNIHSLLDFNITSGQKAINPSLGKDNYVIDYLIDGVITSKSNNAHKDRIMHISDVTGGGYSSN